MRTALHWRTAKNYSLKKVCLKNKINQKKGWV